MPAYPISAVNAITPLGLSARQTVAVARAVGIEPRSVSVLSGAMQGLCVVGGIGSKVIGVDRWAALAQRCVAPLRSLLDGPLPIAIAVPEAGRADDEARVGTEWLREVGGDLALDDEHLAVVRAERAGPGLAVEQAVDWLKAGHARVLVGGVDSHYHPTLLEDLKAAHRLHGAGAINGFIPGEGAGFFVLEAEALDAPMVLDGVATGHDAAATIIPPEDAPPDIAATMTRLLADVAAARGEVSSWVLTDVNGEHHRERWWRLASGRGSVSPTATVEALPQKLGDLGAATGAVAAVMAWVHYESGTAVAPHCTIALHGEDGERAVLSLRGAG